MADYKSIHTTVGLAALVAAETNSTPIVLTEMAVGDGNGNPVTIADLDPDAETLIREVYRDSINTLYQDPDDSTLYYAELVIPASEGGFTMREVGVFDSNGDMHVVGNLPATYKPEVTDGAFADTVIKVAFKVSNAAEITLMIDPSIVQATRSWVLNTIDVCYLLPGGTTGQILMKASNACGDVAWGDPDAIEVVVDTIVEKQTLTTSQVNVDWSTVTTNGLAIYIEGVRIWEGAGADEWQKGTIPLDATRSVLGQSYPDGTEIVGVQNDPAGSVVDALLRDNNLSDLTDVQDARDNLDVYNKSETDQKAPPSLIGYFARSTAPTGWLKANGAEVSRSAYAALFAAIGTTFGAGNGTTTFNLPEGRAEFPRGLDDGRGIDTGRVIGSWQKGSLIAYDTPVNGVWGVSAPIDGVGALTYVGADVMDTSDYTGGITIKGTSNEASSSLPGGTEAWAGVARPRNVAWLCCVKY